MPTSSRLAGHTLPNEGRVFGNAGRWTPTGPAVCSCGEQSEPLDSDNARRRWHRDHKDRMRQQQTTNR